MEHCIAIKMNKTRKANYINIDDNILASMVTQFDTKINVEKLIPKRVIHKRSKG